MRPTIEAALAVSALRDMCEVDASAGLRRGEFVIFASVLSKEEAHQLSAPPGAAAWVIEHTFYGYDERPVSWGCFVCRAELLQFCASVGVGASDAARRAQVEQTGMVRADVSRSKTGTRRRS